MDTAYRIDGDEFAILFLMKNQKKSYKMKQLKL